ncbi:MAG: Rieske 2Fe-2S domain-containing protein [Pseudomonadota bacterium]
MNNDAEITHFVEVIARDQLTEKTVYCAKVGDVGLAICVAKGDVYAVENLCTHAASTFDDGRVRGLFLVCPLHGVMFDLRNGEPKGSMAKQPLRTFATRINEQDMVEIALPT